MEIEVNVSKKRFFILLALLAGILLLIGVIGVYAVWDDTKKTYHDANDVKVRISGIDYSLQEVLDNPSISLESQLPSSEPGFSGTCIWQDADRNGNNKVYVSGGENYYIGGVDLGGCGRSSTSGCISRILYCKR